jgi:hypothetical protein
VTETYLFHCDPRSVADDGDEVTIQRRFINRMKTLAPSVRCVATPNGGNRSAWEKLHAKREGMVKGFPDLNCYWSAGIDLNAIPYVAMLEFKTATGKLSDEQIANLNWLHRHGFPVGCFRSADTAIAFMRKMGAPFSMQVAA